MCSTFLWLFLTWTGIKVQMSILVSLSLSLSLSQDVSISVYLYILSFFLSFFFSFKEIYFCLNWAILKLSLKLSIHSKFKVTTVITFNKLYRRSGGPLVDHLLHTWFHGGTGVQFLAGDELFIWIKGRVIVIVMLSFCSNIDS